MPPNTLSSGEVRDLETIAAHMIPASEEYDVPGANDPAIIADILRSLGRDFAAVRAALADLAARAGGPLGDLDATRGWRSNFWPPTRRISRPSDGWYWAVIIATTA